MLKRHKPVMKSTDWEAFQSEDIEETTVVTIDYVKFCTDNVRKKHKEFLEDKRYMSNPKQLWNSIKSITNIQPIRKAVSSLGDLQMANYLNDFYLRFEKCGHYSSSAMEYSGVPSMISYSLIRSRLIFILNIFALRNQPDLTEFTPFNVIKNCADELTPVCHPIF